MNILILGGGGREHTLAWALSRSPNASRLIVAPGNAGTERIAENVSLNESDSDAVIAFCRDEEIDLVVIGPEAPLVAGLADALRDAGIDVFGPGASAARLEGSKVFSKELMLAEGIPTAKSATVGSVAEAAKALDWLGDRVAVKADGLAAGKGVIMAASRAEALVAVKSFVEDRVFGDAGSRVVLEEWLEGEEVSVIAFVDGEEVRALVPSQDHKRVGEGDVGPNTGGMGAYAPYPGLVGEDLDRVIETCVAPVVRGLAKRGIPYRGVLYAGLMLTADGPRVLEYNVRFGDPETQVILPLFDGDLLEAMTATARGELAAQPPFRISPRSAMSVVLASAGYPASSDPGREISGLGLPDDRGGEIVFHAGTTREEDAIVTAGGRVLAVTGMGNTLADARRAAYDTIGKIRFEGMHYRSDIGARSLGNVTAAPGESAR